MTQTAKNFVEKDPWEEFNDIEQGIKPKEESLLFIPTWNNKPPYKPPLVNINNQSILSYQNITCIVASPGSGKSSTMEAIVSSVLNSESDNLHFTTTAKSVLYIDFERTELDVWNSFYRVMTRSNIYKDTETPSVKIVSFRRIPTAEERKKLIESLIIEFKPELLLLDGIADLVDDTNSLPEAIQLKIWARRITSIYYLSIITTLHPNKGSNSPRGHIGSEMLRECENIMLIKVNDDESRTITTDFEHGKSRNSGHAEGSFVWSESLNMFIGIETVKNSHKTATKTKLEPFDIDLVSYNNILNICYAKTDKLLLKDLSSQLSLAINKEYSVKKGRPFFDEVIIHLQNLGLIKQIGTPRTKSAFYIRATKHTN